MANQKHNLFHYLFTILFTLANHGPRLIIWSIMVVGGYYILTTQKTPVNLILGSPLTLAGIGLAANSVFTIFQSIFYLQYNRERCIFCVPRPFDNHLKVKSILGLKK